MRARLAAVTTGIGAVGSKELRGRMRGPRAFIALTLYLALLAGFTVMIYLLAAQSAASQAAFGGGNPYASASVGQAVFTVLLFLQILLVVFLAPAATSGAISLEREKQTLDLLTATPISTLGIVLGKLGSALAFVGVLILASIPLTAVVFVFGGVGPEDVVRGYVVLLVTALGFGSVGILLSSVTRRTQSATVLTYLVVLVLTVGTGFAWFFWDQMAGTVPVAQPFVRDLPANVGGGDAGGEAERLSGFAPEPTADAHAAAPARGPPLAQPGRRGRGRRVRHGREPLLDRLPAHRRGHRHDPGRRPDADRRPGPDAGQARRSTSGAASRCPMSSATPGGAASSTATLVGRGRPVCLVVDARQLLAARRGRLARDVARPGGPHGPAREPDPSLAGLPAAFPAGGPGMTNPLARPAPSRPSRPTAAPAGPRSRRRRSWGRSAAAFGASAIGSGFAAPCAGRGGPWRSSCWPRSSCSPSPGSCRSRSRRRSPSPSPSSPSRGLVVAVALARPSLGETALAARRRGGACRSPRERAGLRRRDGRGAARSALGEAAAHGPDAAAHAAFVERQREDAVRVLATVPSATFRPRIARRAALLAAVAALLVLPLVLIPNGMDERIARDRAVREESTQTAERIDRSPRSSSAGDAPPDDPRSRLAQELRDLAAELRTDPGALDTNLARLGGVEASVREQLDPANEERAAALAALNRGLSRAATGDAKANAGGDPEKAAADLDRAADGLADEVRRGAGPARPVARRAPGCRVAGGRNGRRRPARRDERAGPRRSRGRRRRAAPAR